MLSISHLTKEEKYRRRQLTDFAVKLTLLAAGAALVVELLYYFLAASPEQRVSFTGLYQLIVVTMVGLILFTLMLGVNKMKSVPYWLVSSLFLLALTSPPLEKCSQGWMWYRKFIKALRGNKHSIPVLQSLESNWRIARSNEPLLW